METIVAALVHSNELAMQRMAARLFYAGLPEPRPVWVEDWNHKEEAPQRVTAGGAENTTCSIIIPKRTTTKVPSRH